MRLAALALILPLLGTSLSAQELRPAPAFYTEAIFAIRMADALALDCPDIQVDFAATQTQVDAMNAQLDQEGFDLDQPFAQMIDFAPQIRGLQDAFTEKYDLADPTSESICAAAHSEMAEATQIGKLLTKDAE